MHARQFPSRHVPSLSNLFSLCPKKHLLQYFTNISLGQLACLALKEKERVAFTGDQTGGDSLISAYPKEGAQVE